MRRTPGILFALLSAASAAGCSASSTELDLAGDASGKADFPGRPAVLELSRDFRPVDGTLTVLRLVRSGKKYDATLRVAGFDRIAGKEFDTTETIGLGLKCTFGDEVFCSRDARPVDGALTELTVFEGELRGYDVTLRTAFFDRLTGKEVDTTETIATGLRIASGLGEACGDDVAIQKQCQDGLVCVFPEGGPISEHTPGICDVACEADECGPRPLFERLCEDGSVSGATECARQAGGECGWLINQCPEDACAPSDCGPRPGFQRLCEDGSTSEAEACVRQDDGECGWYIRECPEDSY